SEEVHELLRQRLRIACSIALFGFGAFLVMNFVRPPELIFQAEPIDQALNYTVVAILAFSCVLLWTSYTLSHTALRVLELVMFGVMAVFFANLQFRVFYPGKLVDLVLPEGLPSVLELSNAANNLRWFFLIVLYGMFIPNTWKRCAIVVGCMA